MGLIAAHTTRQLAEPFSMTWSRHSDDLASVLTDAQSLRFAALRAASRMRAIALTTDWAQRTGKQSSVQSIGFSSGSALRVDPHTDGFSLSLGCARPAGTDYAADWTLRVVGMTDGTARAQLTSWRTSDDQLVHKKTFLDAREQLARSLAEPLGLRLVPGLADLAGWLTPMVGYPSSPPEHDYLAPIPVGFANGAHVVVPEASFAALGAAFGDVGILTPNAAGAHATIDLRPSSLRDRAVLELRQVEGTCWLHLGLPAMELVPTITAQRLFQKTMTTVRALAGRCSEDVELRAALDGWLHQMTASHHSADRVQSLRAVSDRTTESPELDIAPGQWLPIGLVVTTSQKYEFDRVLEASGSLLCRHRTWTRGLSAKSREGNRLYSMRRACRGDGERTGSTNRIRYAQIGPMDLSLLPRGDVDSWYWDARFRLLGEVGDRRRSALVLDGFSTHDHLLTYGAELIELFLGWERAMRGRDPHLEVETLMVDLDSTSTVGLAPPADAGAGLPGVTPGAPAASGPPPPVDSAPCANPPGWYADPWGQAVWRYWDGDRWTTHSG